jgi:hypothetical protein
VVPEVSKERDAFNFNVAGSMKIERSIVEDEGDKFLPNIGNHLPRPSAYHSETPELSIKRLWKTQKSEVRKYGHSF